MSDPNDLAGMGFANIGAAKNLALYADADALQTTALYAALGIPAEFVNGRAEYSTTAASLHLYEDTLRKTQQNWMDRMMNRPSLLSTTYRDEMSFHDFWLENFPRLLALKMGSGPKRIRKKRLKKTLSAVFAGLLHRAPDVRCSSPASPI